MNRLYLNLVLGLLVLSLGAAIFFGPEREPAKAPLTPLGAAAVNSILIEHPGQPAIRIEKRDGAWALTEPVTVAADGFGINGVLELAGTPVEATLEGSPVLADLGLDPAEYTVTLNGQRIEFGGVEPLKYRRYVRAGDKVQLIADPNAASLDADYSDLASRKLLPATAEITRLAVPGLTLTRNESGAWSAAEKPGAAPEAIAKLVEGWTGAESMWNGKADASTPEESTEAATVTLADGSEHRFQIVAKDPQLALVNPATGLRYALSKTLTDTLLALPEPKAEPATDIPAPESAR